MDARQEISGTRDLKGYDKREVLGFELRNEFCEMCFGKKMK